MKKINLVILMMLLTTMICDTNTYIFGTKKMKFHLYQNEFVEDMMKSNKLYKDVWQTQKSTMKIVLQQKSDYQYRRIQSKRKSKKFNQNEMYILHSSWSNRIS